VRKHDEFRREVNTRNLPVAKEVHAKALDPSSRPSFPRSVATVNET